jgi:hypothetical protein
MSLRLDPRRLTAFKRMAAEVGVRPGELARIWIEERIDAERSGAPGGLAALSGLDDLRARLDELVARVAALESAGAPGPAPQLGREPAAAAVAAPEPATDERAEASAEAPAPRRRRRRMTAAERNGDSGRVALHDEIIAVINERGASTAAEIAQAITERGRYMPPRSGKPLDAATVNGRVSNPVYRARFRREDGRIALAEPAGD